MSEHVQWLERTIDSPRVADPAQVAAVERALGVSLPPDFLAIATVHQGARPSPGRLVLADGASTVIERLYHFEDGPYALVNAQGSGIAPLPNSAIAFASGTGGDVLAFDYRRNPLAPPVIVVMHDHSPAVRPVADSFTHMLSLFSKPSWEL